MKLISHSRFSFRPSSASPQWRSATAPTLWRERLVKGPELFIVIIGKFISTSILNNASARGETAFPRLSWNPREQVEKSVYKDDGIEPSDEIIKALISLFS